MKKKFKLLLSLASCTILVFSLCLSAFGADEDPQIITLGAIPADVTVDCASNNLLVKGVDMGKDIYDRSDATYEDAEALMSGTCEMILFPAEYTVNNTPYYIMVFVEDGFTNAGSYLKQLSLDGTSFFYTIIDSLYLDEENASFVPADIGEARYIVADADYITEDGDAAGNRRDYFTIWNGDMVQISLFYVDDYESSLSELISWTEDFISSWTDSE